MFTYNKRRLFFFAFLKEPARAGAALKRWLRLSAQTVHKSSKAALKLAALVPQHWLKDVI